MKAGGGAAATAGAGQPRAAGAGGGRRRRRRTARGSGGCGGRRAAANARERDRTHSVNTAFGALRRLIPTRPADRRLSKVETLRLASSYISHLANVLLLQRRQAEGTAAAQTCTQPCPEPCLQPGETTPRPICTFCLSEQRKRADHLCHKENIYCAYRIIESLWLEKTSEIIESNRPPNATMSTTKPCPQAPHPHIFKHFQGQRFHHLPGQPVPMPENSLSEEILSNSQYEPALMQLEAISSCPITHCLGDQALPYFPSFEVIVKSKKVPPKPPPD